MLPKVLCLINEPAGWERVLDEILSDFRLIQGTAGLQGITKTSLESVDCVLITGSISAADAEIGRASCRERVCWIV